MFELIYSVQTVSKHLLPSGISSSVGFSHEKAKWGKKRSGYNLFLAEYAKTLHLKLCRTQSL